VTFHSVFGDNFLQQGSVGVSVKVRTEGGTGRVESTLTGGLEGKRYGKVYLVLAGVLMGLTLKVRALFIDNARSRYTESLSIFKFLDKA
jgi:hypothetical protein